MRFLAALSYLCLTSLLHAQEFVLHDSPKLALTNATLIDGTGAAARAGQTVLLEDGKIFAILPADRAAEGLIPPDYQVLDMTGHSLTPGLVMMHEHLFYPTGLGNYSEMVHSFPKLYLAGGVTSMRTAGTLAPYADLNLANKISKGELIGPDINVTAPYLNGPGLPILKIKALSGPEDASRMVNYWLSEGVESYKLYMHIHQDEMRTIIDLAHANNQRVTGHLCSITFSEAAELGIDNLEHGFLVATDFAKGKQKDQCPSGRSAQQGLLDLPDDSPKMQALIDKLVAANVAITSTLTVFETYAKGRPIAYKHATDLMNQDVKAQYLSTWSAVQSNERNVWAELLRKEMQWEKAFVEAGGHLMVGTDPTGYGGVVAGWSNIRALELLLESGFSLGETIKIASLNAAEFMQKADSIGTLTAGKRANIAVFKGDLSQDNSALRNIIWTIKDGVVYDSEGIFTAMHGKVGLH